jgi:hypothetical protein
MFARSKEKPVPVAAWSWRLDTETVGWNPAQGMDVYFRLSIIIIHLSPYHHRLVTAKML